VACFLELTHDRLYEALEEHFGSTITALFTDEPNVFGKGPQRPREARPYTPGFADWLEQVWGEDPRPWLPALWLDYGEGTETFRSRYRAAVQRRLHEVFYRAQSAWCRDHGIALTGHPSGSNELTCLRYFQVPGQDMVWRYIRPGDDSGISGGHSVAGKAATSGARITGARRVLTEVCGAYGWRLSLDEVKWLFDWHLVRGNNLINPHAVFYSIRDRRAWESEPDLGIHNAFWPHFPGLAHYARRLSWLLCDGNQVCDVAILGDDNALPWEAARILFESQIDFLYLDDEAVAGAEVTGSRLRAGTQEYAAVIVEGGPALSAASVERLDELRAAGGAVLEFQPGMDLVAALDAHLPRDLRLEPGDAALRFIHYRRDGLDLYLVVNEGEEEIQGEAQIRACGQAEIWDPLRDKRAPLPATPVGDGLRLELSLGRRESLVIAVDPAQPSVPVAAPAVRTTERVPLEVAWQVSVEGHADAPEPLSDWARQPGWELFTGTARYRTEVDLPEADGLELDLGAVGDLAAVRLDGELVATRLWAPYVVALGPAAAPGRHELVVEVTNSMANEYEGAQLLSGLIGPVRLQVTRGA